MAPIPASLQVNFTSEYPVGCHRVYYRIQGSGDPYVYVTVNCTPFVPPGSSACVANIPITVDNETCADVIYEGYVQPCCEVDGSPNGQVPFQVTFTPTPSCIAVQFACNNVGIDDVTINNPGSGYTDGVYAADIIGGGGAGAAIDITITGGIVTGVVVNLPGSGYTSAPVVSVPAIACPGICSAATFIVTMENCPSIGLGATCDDADAGVTTPALLGSSFQICYTGGLGSAPVPPSNYIATEDPTTCCYDCVSLQVSPPPSGPNADVTYIDCTTGQIATLVMISGGEIQSVCARRNSWVTGNAAVGFVVGPVCTP